MMNKLQQKLIAFVKEEEGLTTVEYAVAGSLIALTVVTAFGLLGDEVGLVLDSIRTTLEGTH